MIYPGYELGQPIRVSKGTKMEITVYNGKTNGAIRFYMFASSAIRVSIGSALAVAALAFSV